MASHNHGYYVMEKYVGENDNIIWSDVNKMTLNEYIEFLSSLRDEVGGETDVCVDEDGEYAKEPAVTNFKGYKFVILNY